MDNKRLIIAALVAGALMLVWAPLVDWVGTKAGFDMTPRKPPAAEVATDVPPADEASTRPATQQGTQQAGTPELTTRPADAVEPATKPAALAVAPAEVARPVTLGTVDKSDTMPLGMALTPVGAGVESVTLNQFRAQVDKPAPYVFQRAYADATATAPLATRSITVDGKTVDLDGVPWTLESSDANAATFAATVTDAGEPVLTVRKKFAVVPTDPKAAGAKGTDGPEGYEIDFDYTFQNLTDRPLKVATTFNGPTTPPRELERGVDRQVIAGYWDKDDVTYRAEAIEGYSDTYNNRAFAVNDKKLPVMWAGADSVYFDAIVRPIPLEAGAPTAKWVESITASLHDPNAKASGNHEINLAFATAEQTVKPNASLTLPMKVYFGPKWRKILTNGHYAAPAVSYNETLIAPSYCPLSFDWLIGPLVWLLAAFRAVFRDWGLAIIGLVVLVRLCLHPITKRAQVNMLKMGKMGPEIERLKKKHGEDKEALNKAMMGFYKEQGTAPILGCLPMFLQTPIWIALWQALNSTFELRHAPFLYGYTWIHDLSKPDHLIDFANFGWKPIDVFFLHISGLNLLPILLGGIFFLQMKVQPRPVTMTPEQEQQQKIMKFAMPFIFPLFLYASPSGLCLYILTSTSIGIIESKRIRDHIKEKEAAEGEGKILVETKTRSSNKPKPRIGGPVDPEPKKTGLGGWLANLQQKAEDLQRQAEKRSGNKRA